MYYKTCHEKNIICPKDLQDQNGNLMSFFDFQTKYKIRLTFLHYLGLLGAIPNRYEDVLARPDNLNVKNTQINNAYTM